MLSLLFACTTPEPVPSAPPPAAEPAPPSCAELPISAVQGEAWRDGESAGVTLLVRAAGGEHACARLLVLDPQTGEARTASELLFVEGYSTSGLRWWGLDAAGTLWLHRDDQGLEAYELRTGARLLSAEAFWQRNPDLRAHIEGDGGEVVFDRHRRLVFSRDDGLRQFIDPRDQTARSVLEAEPPIAFEKPQQSPCDRSQSRQPLRMEGWPAGEGTLHAEQEPGATWQRQRLYLRTPAGRADVEGAFLIPEAMYDSAYSLDNQQWGCTPIGDSSGVVVQHVETLRGDAERLITRIGPDGHRLWEANLGAGRTPTWVTEIDGRLILVAQEEAVALDVQRGTLAWRVGR